MVALSTHGNRLIMLITCSTYILGHLKGSFLLDAASYNCHQRKLLSRR